MRILIFALNDEIVEISEEAMNRYWPESKRDYFSFKKEKPPKPVDLKETNIVVILDYLDPDYHSLANNYIGIHALEMLKELQYNGVLVVSLISGPPKRITVYEPHGQLNENASILNVDLKRFQTFKKTIFVPDYCIGDLPNILKTEVLLK